MKSVVILLLSMLLLAPARLSFADPAHWPANLYDPDQRDPTTPKFTVSSEEAAPDTNITEIAFKPAFTEQLLEASQYSLLHSPFTVPGDWLLYQDPASGPPVLVASAVSAGPLNGGATMRVVFHLVPKSITAGAKLYLALRIHPKDVGALGHPRVIDTLIFTHEGMTPQAHPYVSFTYGLGPVPNQALEDGSHTFVLEAPIEIKVPHIVETPYASALFLSLKSVLSTQSRDTNAGFNFTFGFNQTFFPKPPLRYVLMENSVSAISNLRGTTHGLIATSHFQVPVPSTNFTFGHVLSTDEQLHLEAWPVRFEYRDKIDPMISASHARTFLYAPSLKASWANLLIFPTGNDVDSNVALSLSGQVWYFPSEQALGGTSARKQESRFDAQVRFPLWKEKKLFGIVTFGTGANPNSGYARSVQFGFFLQFFGQSIKLSQVGTP